MFLIHHKFWGWPIFKFYKEMSLATFFYHTHMSLRLLLRNYFFLIWFNRCLAVEWRCRILNLLEVYMKKGLHVYCKNLKFMSLWNSFLTYVQIYVFWQHFNLNKLIFFSILFCKVCYICFLHPSTSYVFNPDPGLSLTSSSLSFLFSGLLGIS